MAATGPASAEDDALIAAVRGTPAGAYAPGLAPAPLGDWLRRELPKGAVLLWETNDCGEQTGEPELDAGREFPTCVGLRIELPSRDRVVDLLFAVDPPAFVIGTLDSPSAVAPRRIDSLADLPAAVNRPLVLLGLACPDGTQGSVATEYAGAVETCRREGTLDGPYRSWFRTGLYLTEKGTWREGVRVGPWIVCDHFERCERVTYDDAGAEVSRRAIRGSP